MNKKILAFVYDQKANKFLALRNNSKDPKHGGDFWFTVTGSLENKESFEQAVKREVKEETNLEVKELFFLKWGCIYKWNDRQNEEKYFMAFVESGEVKLNEEHTEHQWLSLEEYVKKINWKEDKSQLLTYLKDGVNKKIQFGYTIIDDFIDRRKRYFIKGNKKIEATWIQTNDFSHIKNVSQSYGVCFDESGKFLIIKTTRVWSLPGGSPEKAESYEQTLKREVDEEGDVDIDSLIPLGYNKVIEYKNGKTTRRYNQLRYFARITKVKKQTIDPATGVIPKRKMIAPQEFLSYCPWGSLGEMMIKEALKAYKKSNNLI